MFWVPNLHPERAIYGNVDIRLLRHLSHWDGSSCEGEQEGGDKVRHVGPEHTHSSLSPYSSIRPFAHPSSVVTPDHYQGCPLHCPFGASEEARPRAQRGGQGRGRGGEGGTPTFAERRAALDSCGQRRRHEEQERSKSRQSKC